jgi:hypothetical protein
MNLNFKHVILFKLALIPFLFASNTVEAQSRPTCRGDSVSNARKDCYNFVKPFDLPSPLGDQDDVFHFCTYGDKKANVFITPPDKNTGAKATPTYCPAVCAKDMTTYDKEIKGDPTTGPPNDLVRRPNPTAPDPLTCNPAGIAFLGLAAACIPKYCPCTNFAIQVLWTQVCSNRETGIWGK